MCGQIKAPSHPFLLLSALCRLGGWAQDLASPCTEHSEQQEGQPWARAERPSWEDRAAASTTPQRTVLPH